MSDTIRFEAFTYPSADGKSTVHAYIWAPESPRGIIQLSHGMCEYVQRYDAWARRFAEAGFVFAGNDHLGHGQTAPDKETLGYTAPRGGADLLVEDLHQMTEALKTRFPGLPIVLYGHSMGSFAARLYLSRYGEELAAALISGTAGPEAPAAVARTLAHAIGKTKGYHHRSKLLTSLAFGSYNRRFAKEQDEHSWLTRDAAVRQCYRNDPFCRFVFTVAGYETLFSLLAAVSDKRHAAALPKSLPILVFAGEDDPVGAFGKGVREVHRRMVAAGCNATLQLYPGARHEMHHEQERDTVFADLLRFLNGIPALQKGADTHEP